ncbi:MAG TPA: PcfJ domain-containing protein [Kofleriaceae bacterium]
MNTDSFRRHARACVDIAIHAVYRSHPGELFDRLLRVARPRSVALVQALASLARYEPIRDPESWAGATGHPLGVTASLASHLYGQYPVPRFLASVWFGADDARHRWYLEHARGRPFRRLPLPIAMSRQMEHLFLRSPDPMSASHALRRAEILGLGGSPALVDAILQTRLGDHFDAPERWRAALLWFASRDVPLAQVAPIVDFLEANPTVDPTGRTVARVLHLMHEWHVALVRSRWAITRWAASRWTGFAIGVKGGEWTFVELLDSHALRQEGREMRHCVASYARSCVRGDSSIWSLRFRRRDQDEARPVLTVEVYPRTGSVAQIRGKANALPADAPLDLVLAWAIRNGLTAKQWLPRLVRA